MRILVVEDEKKVAHFIEKGLKEHSFSVDVAQDGEDGFFMATGEEYDCIVLDILLPKMDGYELLRAIRSKSIKTPVIFLTAKDTVDDRVKGLELGGDDYLVKPFAFAELLARIRALVRRGKEKKVDKLKVGDLSLNLLTRIVVRAGKKIELTPKEYSLLQYLMENRGRVLTRTMISENVWGYDFDTFTNVIDVHINALRDKIDKSFPVRLIHTVRGVGYVLEKREEK